MSTPLFETRNVSIAFGGLKAVDDFTLTMQRGDLQGLIGPNGAGKTTAFNLITGVYQPDHGAIQLGGRSLLGLPPWKIAREGVARTFQNIRLFPDLSVLDNVRVACHLRTKANMFQMLMRTRQYYLDEAELSARSHQLLEAIDLQDRADDLARNLPYGDQRRLEIARALATEPKVLLLDEPAAGMNPSEKQELVILIRSIRQRFGLTILLIEHDMGLVMKVCEKIMVLDYGKTIAVGTPGEVQKNPDVVKAYLGEPASAGP
ncbi:MAG: ABC transporter ATP-binding protein [Phycisphaeraceae bacterium]